MLVPLKVAVTAAVRRQINNQMSMSTYLFLAKSSTYVIRTGKSTYLVVAAAAEALT